VQRNPYLQDDMLDNPRRRRLLIEALQHRLGEVEKRRTPGRRPWPRRGRRRAAAALRAAVDAFAARFREMWDLRKRTVRRLARVTAKDNIKFDGLSRVSHVTDATDWRVEYPFVVLTPDTEAEMAALVGRLHRARPDDHPARRRHRLHRRRGAAHLGERGHQHREARGDDRGRAGRPARRRRHGGDDLERGGVVTQRVADAAERAGFVFAVDPTSAEASCIGGNVAMNAGGKKAGALGHRARQPRLLADGHARSQVARGDALDHNLGKIHDAPTASFELKLLRCRAAGSSSAPSGSTSRRRVSARKASARTSPTSSSPACPGIQKEGCDGLITSARWIVHRMPEHVRTVCLEFFGNAKDAVPSIVEIRDYLFGLGASDAGGSRVLLAGLEHLDDRYLKAVGYADQEQARRPAEDGARRRHRRRRRRRGGAGDERGRAHRQRARGEGFVAVSAEARKKFWLDRKRTAAISKHTNAFKINEDVVIPLPRMGEYTEGIERINIELSLANKLRLVDRLEASSSPARCRSARATTPARSPRPSCSRTGCSRRSRCCARSAACGGAGSASTSSPGPLPQAGEGRRAVFALLQDHTLRASWKTQIRRAAAVDLRRRGAEADRRRVPAASTPRC
jgi:FAD/FMN-containing dehydrogenase